MLGSWWMITYKGGGKKGCVYVGGGGGELTHSIMCFKALLPIEQTLVQLYIDLKVYAYFLTKEKYWYISLSTSQVLNSEHSDIVML